MNETTPPGDARDLSTGGDATTRTALKWPVFIVGSPRSGTSILINGLLACGYHGFREGNFLPLMRVFDRDMERHFAAFGGSSDQVLAHRIDRDVFRREIMETFKRHVDALNPQAPWIDKSGNPDMIEAIPAILQLWPAAIFIFAKRRAIENVASRVKKFPNRVFDYHCRDWASNMTAWRAMRDHPGLRALEIDQQEIAQSPEHTAKRLALFLGASDAARQRIAATFSGDRPQQTEEGSATRTLDLDSTGWSPDQIDTFMRLCWNEMLLYGYSLTPSYWARPDGETAPEDGFFANPGWR